MGSVRRFAANALLALASAGALAVSVWLDMGEAFVPPPWVLDGMLLGVLLRSERRRWPGLMVAAFIGAALCWIYVDGRLVAGIVLASCTLVLLSSAVALLDWLSWRPADLATSRGLVRGSAVVLGAAPLLPALLVVLTGHLLSDHDALATMGHWLLTEVLGLAIITPLAVNLARRDMMLLFVPPVLGTTLALLVTYTAIAAVVFLQGAVPLSFLLFPPLCFMVGRLGPAGAGLGILITGVVAAAGAVWQFGPLGHHVGMSAYRQVMFLQFLLVVASVMVYPLGAAVAARRRMNQALADQHARLSRNENLYRLLANNSSDIITRVRLDGKRLYVSPSITAVLGWTPAEMLQPNWQDYVHPDDLAGFVAARENTADSNGNSSFTYRYRHKNGTWCWLEARMHLIRRADGLATELVGNLRDVTRQKEAELALEAAMIELSEKAATDGLTGVANRRRFDDALELEWRRSLRTGEAMAVLMVDADHFKSYNDRYGHQAGDGCLRALARAIGEQIRRPHDLLARYGGEEFVVILPGTGIEGALQVAERIRRGVEALDMAHEANADGVVTISIGAASMVPDHDSAAAALVEAADGALYLAKRNGRNRVELAVPRTGTAVVVPLLPHLRRAAASQAGLAT